MKLLSLGLALAASMAFAKVEISEDPARPTAPITKEASNSAIECMAQLSDIIGKRLGMLDAGGPDKTNVGAGLLRRYMSICKRSSPLVENLNSRLKQAGYKQPRQVMNELFEASKDEFGSRLRKLKVKFSPPEAKNLQAAFADLHTLADLGARSKTATSIPADSQNAPNSAK